MVPEDHHRPACTAWQAGKQIRHYFEVWEVQIMLSELSQQCRDFERDMEREIQLVHSARQMIGQVKQTGRCFEVSGCPQAITYLLALPGEPVGEHSHLLAHG